MTWRWEARRSLWAASPRAERRSCEPAVETGDRRESAAESREVDGACQLYGPESGLHVRCVAAETPGGWDAQFLARSLRTKQKM